jgi:hypothetical protein
MAAQLAGDETERKRLVQRGTGLLDGRGVERVAEAMGLQAPAQAAGQ